MSEKTLIGQNLTRLDAYDKVIGKYIYGMDHNIPGALESVVLRSPFPHARILRIDTHKAEALEGVRAVITAKEISGLLMPGTIQDQPPLAVDVVRFWGEPVALIAADSREIAETGARLIEVEYESLPVVSDPEAAMQPDSPLVHPNWKSYNTVDELNRSGNISCHAQLKKGNVEEGFTKADFIIEEEFSTESVHQSHVEPRAATAKIEPDGVFTIYTNTQLPWHTRASVAYALGVPEEQVVIIPTGIGGGFGSKLYPQIEPLVAFLARKTGRAVHMFTPLEEELADSLPRHPIKFKFKTGVKSDGSFTAIQARAIIDNGAYAGSGPQIAGIEALLLAGLYRVLNIQIDAYSVYTNKMNFGAYRGPGGPQAVFALESHIDTIAGKMRIDPLEFRLQNILKEGDDAPNGQILQGMGLRETMEKATAAIEWDKPPRPNRGKGMAIGWWTTTLEKSTCMVELDMEGRVLVSVGTQEIGNGAVMGGVPQVVAETMGVGMEDVIMNVTSTDKGLWDWGSQGSRVLFNVGRAAQFACFELIERLKNLASFVLEVDPSELDVRENSVLLRSDPKVRISLSKIVKLDSEGDLKVVYESNPTPTPYDESRVKACLYPVFHYPSFHCHAAEVEVDPETGQVSILRYAAAHDIGRAVNPSLIKGQIQGGAAQGIGMSLMEEVRYKDGYRENTSWTDYKIPTINDVPDIEAIIVEHGISGGGPYDLKGLGESPTLEPPAALANAIARAAGVRIRSLPMTAERVLKTIRSKE